MDPKSRPKRVFDPNPEFCTGFGGMVWKGSEKGGRKSGCGPKGSLGGILLGSHLGSFWNVDVPWFPRSRSKMDLFRMLVWEV